MSLSWNEANKILNGYNMQEKFIKLWPKYLIEINCEELLIKIMNVWKKKPPKKEILLEFKKLLNIKFDADVDCSIFKNITLTEYIIEITFSSDILREYKMKFENCFLLMELLAYYDVEVDKYVYRIDEILKPLEICRNIMIRMTAGKKIAKYIEKQMDDEFEMKPLRTKIDMRKIEEDKI